MKIFGRVVVAVAVVAMCAGGARADEALKPQRVVAPENGMAAALANVVFIPVRLGISVIGGELGGLVGFLTAGDRDATESVWGLFQGQNIVTPEMAAGREPLEFGSLEFRAEPRR